MKILRSKIKRIIYSNGGLPGLDKSEYIKEMTAIINSELTNEDQVKLHQNQINLENLIIELSQELAEEYL